MRHLSILLAGSLTACAATTPHWDQRFGVDTRLALAQQIARPAAGRNADPVSGMDGRSARSAYERYQKAAGEAAQSVMNGGAK